MTTDNTTYLFFDKFCGSHSYNNPKTVNVSMNDIFNITDFLEIKYGDDAIQTYNSYALSANKIKEKIDTEFYKIIYYGPKVITSDSVRCVVVGVNHELLSNNYDNIPNKNFLLYVCTCHVNYQRYLKKENTSTPGYKKEVLTKLANEANTDMTDNIIETPKFTKLNLFDYQRRTVKWMYDKEINSPVVKYNFNSEISLGDYSYDIIKKELITQKDKKEIKFNGGLLADEVGLGKTFQTIALSLLHQSKNVNYFNDKLKRLQSRATIIICPNQLCNQWIREIQKTIKDDYKVNIVPLMTKIHFDKYTYLDVLDADFVIVSYNFLGNDATYEWLNGIRTTSKMSTYFNSLNKKMDSELEATFTVINNKLDSIYNDIKTDPTKLFNKGVNLNLINFHRCAYDEFHEIWTVDKYAYLRKFIQLLHADYKWCITGTPFNKSNCIEDMMNYVTGYTLKDTSRVFNNDNVFNYITKQFFRRNTKQSIKNEYKLEPYTEEIILMKFSPTERAIYSAYLANPSVNKFSELVRQLCDDPRLADEIKLSLSQCKTPEDIENTMITHYSTIAKNAETKIDKMKYKISKLERKILIVSYKHIRKQLRTKYLVTIQYPPKIYDSRFEKKKTNVQDDDDEKSEEETNDSSGDEDWPESKRLTIDATTVKTHKVIKAIADKTPDTVVYNNLLVRRVNMNTELEQLKKDYNGKLATYNFFKTMLEKLSKLKDKVKKDMDDSDCSDDDGDEDEDICPICLNEITGDDVGVINKCGHLFCYNCITNIIRTQPRCPKCTKNITGSDIIKISYEKYKPTDDKEINDKMKLINKVGTKLANLILYLKKTNSKAIVFSQWDSMLTRAGYELAAHGINNVYCKGNVWSRDKAIRDFTTQEDVQVIMLSSESSAAGTNLTAAETVILLDPIYKNDTNVENGIGSYEYRRNMEWQAIGRAYRMGQTKKVKVIRFIIKDTVEEEIYNINKAEDAKFKDNKDLIDKLIEVDDTTIDATKDVLDEITNKAENYKGKKQLKGKKKVIEEVSEEDFSDEDDEDDE